MNVLLSCILVSLFTCMFMETDFWQELRLPDKHIPHYFHNHPDLADKCRRQEECPYKEYVDAPACWGLEAACDVKEKVQQVDCHEDCVTEWAEDKFDQKDKFWRQADFGYLLETQQEMTELCSGQDHMDSSLRCSSNTRFCYATHLYLDLRSFNFQDSRNRYREDVFTRSGLIGGHCKLDKNKLEAQSGHKSPLQSWYAELEHYTSLDFLPSDSTHCDITIDKPVILIKLDAGINMYHHFCDFVNLYASQHLNQSFDLDVQIIMWDTSSMQYGDFFDVTWSAFSRHPILSLHELSGRRVCLRSAMMPLLARMRYGLYYNMPLIPGCQASSLFQAFSQHVLHRLNVTQTGPLTDTNLLAAGRVRVTLLERRTSYRNILNQEEIVAALQEVPHYEVKVAHYSHKMTFVEQLQMTHNSDILIGMHGAGLTHVLFQPDWGALFEVYNCEDRYCYSDLARLRGVKYYTWQEMSGVHKKDEGHHPTLGAHAKFTDYSFDVNAFLRVVAKAATHVQTHPIFIEATNVRYKKNALIHDDL